MDFTQRLAEQSAPELVSGCLDDIAFIFDTQPMAPMAGHALERIRLRLHRLGMLVDRAEIVEAQASCQSL